MTLFGGAPYDNLVITGAMGVGKTTVGQLVARRFDAEYFDLENEVLSREGRTADQIREMFGESRLKAIETDALRELILRRHSVLVVPGPTVIDEVNRARLLESGVVVCLTSALNEILRRIYIVRGAWFHNPANRGVILSRLKRERRVQELDLPQIDTSRLSVDEAVEQVAAFWLESAQR